MDKKRNGTFEPDKLAHNICAKKCKKLCKNKQNCQILFVKNFKKTLKKTCAKKQKIAQLKKLAMTASTTSKPFLISANEELI